MNTVFRHTGEQIAFLFLAISLPVGAGEVPPHIARGHLLAAYCVASPETKLKQVTAIYREIIPVAAPPGSYTTVAFSGGYVGLAGNKDNTGGDTINFSIWGEDAAKLSRRTNTSARSRHDSLRTKARAGRDGWRIPGRSGHAIKSSST